MRTVICHFFNEAYMLPWWLKHHVPMFDYGIMIDHGSTDDSLQIIRDLAPHWRIVHTRLTAFDAYLTDFEVMSYEQEVPGWKIALNVTEFLVSTIPLVDVERYLTESSRIGCSASGFICVDHEPAVLPAYDRSLLLQKHWGYDDNSILEEPARIAQGYSPIPYRNRFYHSNPTGMYHPGRHRSFHPDAMLRVFELAVLYYGFAPWNKYLLQRKLQVKSRVPKTDLDRGWGQHHFKTATDLENEFNQARILSSDLFNHPIIGRALQR